MRIYGRTLLLALCCACLSTSVQAGWWANFNRDYRRNNEWPDHFTPADRQAANAPFGIMIQNGWRAQNTLGAHHFKEDGSDLTAAGALKVRWILTDAPEQHRVIFVERGASLEETSTRINSVRNVAVQMSTDGEPATIMETTSPVRGWPADYIDAIDRKAKDSIPPPRLRAPTGDGTGS